MDTRCWVKRTRNQNLGIKIQKIKGESEINTIIDIK
jgi:hypothetical protein